MKLISLIINTEFRSLPVGFKIVFFDENNFTNTYDFAPYCLVGRNGSGKSNVLEAIASIFYHIECMHLVTLPEPFEKDELNPKGFDRSICIIDEFELEYLCKNVEDNNSFSINSELEINHIKISKVKGEAPKIYKRKVNDMEAISHELTGKLEVKEILPQFIIGYSSGENELLSLPFFKLRFLQFDAYLIRLKKAYDSLKSESSFVYLDESFNQAILLSLYLLDYHEVEENSIDKLLLTPLIEEIGIQDIKSFRIVIRKDISETYHLEYFSSLSENDKQKEYKTKVSLTYNVEAIIEKLKKCSTSSFYVEVDDDISNKGSLLYLDYFVNKETKKAFKRIFGSSLNLFQSFQILLNLNLYQVNTELKTKIYQSKNIFLNDDIVPIPYDEDRIFKFKDLELIKVNVKETIYTKQLSDGEFQLLHTIGLCLIFRDTNSLFLLDEPETHFNPEWRAKFITTIANCLKTDKKFLRDLLITSHSPFIVSDCKPDNVYIFNRDKEKLFVESAAKKRLNTFGTSVNVLTEEIFNKTESLGDYSLEILNKIRNRTFDSLEEIQKAKEDSRILGDSAEKILLFRELLLKEKELNKND